VVAFRELIVASLWKGGCRSIGAVSGIVGPGDSYGLPEIWREQVRPAHDRERFGVKSARLSRPERSYWSFAKAQDRILRLRRAPALSSPPCGSLADFPPL